jgi:acyl-CoA dehydrogenase
VAVSIDFSLPDELAALQRRTRDFIRDAVIPLEPREHGVHGINQDLRKELQQRAKDAGLFAPQVGRDLGGLGLDMRGRSVVFEEAGYSLLGPQALNCAAPDEGNMHLLAAVANPEQKARYLAPLAAGEIRSCFAMTEPAPGAGSDPSMLQTTATRAPGGWVINGHKWFISGAPGAAFAICMARTSEPVPRQRPGQEGATMFLVDAGTPGFTVVRTIEAMDRIFAAGHAEVLFEECFVPEDAVLGEVDRGFHYAQVRLAPARLTHCMRWLGIARRALDFALDRAAQREAFGQRLDALGMVQQMIADSVIDIHTSRLAIWHASWVLDSGGDARQESSIAKTYVAEAVNRVVDRAIQICGSLGVSGDAPLARFLTEVRPFRIYDGPSETHRWAIARRVVRQRAQERASRDG